MNQYKNDALQKLKALNDPRVLGLVVFGIVTLLVTWSGVKVVQANYELEKRIATLKQSNEVQKLENENQKLRNAYYESDQFLELAARRQFGKAAPGETLYLVPKDVALSKTIDTPSNQKLTSRAETPKSKYEQNFEDWMDFLF